MTSTAEADKEKYMSRIIKMEREPEKGSPVEKRVMWYLNTAEGQIEVAHGMVYMSIHNFHDADIGQIDIQLGRIERDLASIRRFVNEARETRMSGEPDVTDVPF